MFTIDVVIAYA